MANNGDSNSDNGGGVGLSPSQLRHSQYQTRRRSNVAKDRFCQRCGIRYAAIPRCEGTDHCRWCEDDLKAGHVVLGVGYDVAGGFLQRQLTAPASYRALRVRPRRTRACACGKMIDARSRYCGSCSQSRRHAREHEEKVRA